MTTYIEKEPRECEWVTARVLVVSSGHEMKEVLVRNNMSYLCAYYLDGLPRHLLITQEQATKLIASGIEERSRQCTCTECQCGRHKTNTCNPED